MERIKLNLIPSGVAPIVHLSQYDDGRQFGIDLFEGESVYVLDGTETLTVNSRKPDGHVVVLAVTNTGTSSLDVDTVEQLTAVHGVSYAKLKIEKGSVTIATLPFLIDVSRDPLENGDPSESFIQNLETQVSEMVAEDVAEQYDSANVIFDNEPTDNHGIGYTVTSEGIKTAIDNAFDYDNTASGSLVHITDGADNIPVKSLVSEIVAVETGNGQPKSPDNPYIISGFDSGVIKVSNHSTVVETSTQKYVDANGIITQSVPSFPYKYVIARVKQGETYTYSVNGVATTISVMAFFDKYPLTGSQSYNSSRLVEQNATFISPINGYVFIRGNGSFDEVNQMVASGTSTEYEQGNTYTFTFGQTVYGGHFDNKGNLVVTHGYIASYNGETINEPWISSMDDYVPNTSPSTGAQVVYPLTTPTTLAITSQDIPTLLGENNIFSNCGDVEVNYYTNKSNDILEFIDSEIGKKNGTNIPIEANSQDSIKDYVDDEISSTKDYVDDEISSTKDYVDDGLNDKVAYKSGEVVYSNYVTGAYVSGSGNYVEFCVPINTKATSGTITNLGTTLNVFIGNTRLTNEVTLSDSSVVAIKDGYAQIELKLNSTQTANSVATVSLDGFTVNFA